jgi:hypothetical protein
MLLGHSPFAYANITLIIKDNKNVVKKVKKVMQLIGLGRILIGRLVLLQHLTWLVPL